MSLRWVRRFYPLVLAVLAAYFALAPGQRPVAVVLVGAFVAAVVAYGAIAQRSPRRGSWLILAVAIVLLSVAFLADIQSRPFRRPHEYPLLPNLFYLLAFLPLAVGLLWLGRPRIPSRDVSTMLDTIALTLAIGLVAWILILRPEIHNLGLSAAGQVTAVATWVGFVVVLAAALRVVLGWRMNVALASVTLGVASLLVAAFVFGVARVNGTTPDVAVIGVEFLVACGLLGAGALAPSMVTVASVRFGRYRLGPWRMTMLAVALLVAPTILLVEAASGAVTTALAIALLSATLGGLMLIRLLLVVRAYRRRAALDKVNLVAMRAMVVATTHEEVEAAVAAAFRDMLPARARPHAVLTDHAPGDFSEAAVAAVETPAARPDGTGELRVALDHEQGRSVTVHRSLVFTGAIEPLTEHSAALQVLAGQAASALARIDLMARLQSEERERYFRTLVLTSSDVILICRHGRVEYATPSAYAMFGRDVSGERLDDVVEHRGFHEAERHVFSPWSDIEVGTEGHVRRPDGADLTVQVRRRDLRDDPSIGGIVTTLRDVTKEQEVQRGLAYRASHDALTGLANAELFRDELSADRDVVRHGMSAALFIDLDDFKMINDRYGHEVGDGMLVIVARRIQSCLSGEDLAARLGGDEFGVLLRRVPDEAAARAAAARIVEVLARPAAVAGVDVQGRASVGLAVARTPAETDSLLRRADTALYRAKAEGKSRWQEYQNGMATPGRRTTDLRHSLEAAIRAETLIVHYEPIVNLSSGQTAGFDALISFDRGPDRAMQPEELDAITEDEALIISFGNWLLRKALTDLALINSAEPGDDKYVSVNVSPRQLRQPGFVDTVRAQLATTSVDASSLVLEITESVLLADDERAWNALRQLRDDGVRVALEDYGIGYASLGSLRSVSVDIVKIDRSFLEDLHSQRPRILLEAVIRLAATLRIDPIAEGVEDTYTRHVLLSMGCRYGQGQLYAAPMPAPEAARWQPPRDVAARLST